MPRGSTGTLLAQDQTTAMLAVGAIGFGLALAMLEGLTEASPVFEDLGHLAPIDGIAQGPPIGFRLHWGNRIWSGSTRGSSTCGDWDRPVGITHSIDFLDHTA